jgi:hypothetical protein
MLIIFTIAPGSIAFPISIFLPLVTNRSHRRKDGHQEYWRAEKSEALNHAART